MGLREGQWFGNDALNNIAVLVSQLCRGRHIYGGPLQRRMREYYHLTTEIDQQFLELRSKGEVVRNAGTLRR